MVTQMGVVPLAARQELLIPARLAFHRSCKVIASTRSVALPRTTYQTCSSNCNSWNRFSCPFKLAFPRIHWPRKFRRKSAPDGFCIVARLLEPSVFEPSKLSVQFMETPLDDTTCASFLPRQYTLTHNDMTATICLSVGPCMNSAQVSNWMTRLFRDEVVAEWRAHGPANQELSLHVHCHVSGDHALMAPAALRDWIFQREMPLILQCIRFADNELIASVPQLDDATVWVHFHSSDSHLNRADCWGPLAIAAQSRRDLPPTLSRFFTDSLRSFIRQRIKAMSFFVSSVSWQAAGPAGQGDILGSSSRRGSRISSSSSRRRMQQEESQKGLEGSLKPEGGVEGWEQQEERLPTMRLVWPLREWDGGSLSLAIVSSIILFICYLDLVYVAPLVMASGL